MKQDETSRRHYSSGFSYDDFYLSHSVSDFLMPKGDEGQELVVRKGTKSIDSSRLSVARGRGPFIGEIGEVAHRGRSKVLYVGKRGVGGSLYCLEPASLDDSSGFLPSFSLASSVFEDCSKLEVDTDLLVLNEVDVCLGWDDKRTEAIKEVRKIVAVRFDRMLSTFAFRLQSREKTEFVVSRGGSFSYPISKGFLDRVPVAPENWKKFSSRFLFELVKFLEIHKYERAWGGMRLSGGNIVLDILPKKRKTLENFVKADEVKVFDL